MDWPSGKERALGGKSAIDALRDAMGQTKRGIEYLKEDDLALAFAGQIIRQMYLLGVVSAARKSNREPNPSLPSDEWHI